MSENTPPEPSPQPDYAQSAVTPMLESEARTWSMLVHIIAVAALILSGGTLGFVAPLVLWLIYRERSALVDFHGKQNLNLQLTLLVTGIAAVILGTLLFVVGLAVTLPLWFAYCVYALVISIIAGIKANSGEYYPITFTIRFLR
ncbi:DUF4870 domain-containing protein [Demequina sp. SO4-13]|uniref:DUF4870 domain-containing protein n=1 Tax=Demequina sp. SO4-13 TaxID=3401027 RepID=UPI003AF516C1